MASGRVLLAVIVSLFAVAFAGSGYECSTDPTNGLFPISSSHFTDLEAANAQPVDIELDAFTITPSTNNVPINSYTRGTCQFWGKNANGYPVPSKIAWAEWDLTSFSNTRSVQAFLQLTEPHDGKDYSTRLTVVWMAASVTSANKCSSLGDIQNVNWKCEAFIKDSCQGYGTSNERIYSFIGGRRYFLIFDSADSTASKFDLKFVPRNGIINRQEWESMPALIEDKSGGTPQAGWSRSSDNHWAVYNTQDYKIGIAGWDFTNWPDWTGLSATTNLVGEIGSRIIMSIPNYIPGQTANGGYTAEDFSYTCNNYPGPGQHPSCDHSSDNLYSPVYTLNLAGVTNYDLEVEYFWYDGRNDGQPVASGTAAVYASATAGGPWTHLKDMDNVVDNAWAVDRIPIPDAIVSTGSAYFRFELRSVDNKLGWAMNGIQVVPHLNYDQCNDEVACTENKCSNKYTLSGATRVYEAHGCWNPSDFETCEDKDTECRSWLCEPTEAGTDEDGCESADHPEVCEDNHDCTENICGAAGVCEYTPHDDRCEDNRGCTRNKCLIPGDENYDEADAEGCFFEATCDDEVACTVDTCEEAAIGGDKCLHTIDFNLCEDNIDCTYELVCDPEQPGMDPVSGCIRIPMDEWCDDNDACTIDTCQPLREGVEGQEASDKCFHDEMNCDDCIECTKDSCEEGECVNEAENDLCNDHVECTYDFCNKELGKCQNIPIDDTCYDQVGVTACDVFVCRPNQTESDAFGCIKSIKECDDDLACTKDTCVDHEGEATCEHEANNEACDDGEGRCTDDYCDKDLGKCVNVPNSAHCIDNSVCTVNFCGRDGKCYFPEIDVSDDIYCTVDECDPVTGITHEAEDTLCIDAWDCTDDKCDVNLGGCTNIPNDGFCATVGHSLCSTWVCNIGIAEEGSDGCVGTPIDCDDGIPCTLDTCNPATGLCEHAERNDFCNDGFNCTDDVCSDVIGCINTANNANCTDNKLCTIDICGCDGQCYNEPIVCDDNIPCTHDFCDPADGLCKAEIVGQPCDDGIACTVDACDLSLGQCTNIEIDANCTSSADGCYVSECSIEAEGCVPHFNHDMCDDHIPCTYDECTTAGCVHTEMNTLCNDGLDCTLDTCDADKFGCIFTPIDERCDDFSNCTTHICSTVKGCVIVPDHLACDDGVDCTEDVCDSPLGEASGCSHYNRNAWCDDGIGCTDDVCTGTTCTHTPVHSLCDDGWDCSADDTCVEDIGCVYDDSTCPWFVAKDPLCLECTTSSAQILQLNYTDGTGAMQFATRDAETDELKANIVALPTDQVIIGGASQAEVRVGSSDGLVINDNIRLVPLEDAADRPECNEIRRGSIIVVPKSVACGSHTCHEDVVQVCSKQQDYEWVTLKY